MGRYYNGDIKGKFWFAVQNSDDASFFGGVSGQPDDEERFIHYSFNTLDIPRIQDGLVACDKALGDWQGKLKTFFEQNNGYNEQMLEEQLGLKREKALEILQWFARRELGQKILDCVKHRGSCVFDAEL